MNKQLAMILAILVIGGFAIALAEKKSSARLRVVVLEGKSANLELSFNPEEISIEKVVPWQTSKAADPNQTPAVEIDTAGSSTIFFESAFDLSQANENVYHKHIRPIENLTLADEQLKRPPRVRLIWNPPGALPTFEGVISSVSAKYTMFLSDGTPVRATAGLSFREARDAAVREDDCPEDGEDCPEH